nr:proline-rich receptor-like protein kinase PERK2 [Aegilops tauschii subsp. strangulata]
MMKGEPLELEIELELPRLGSSAFARYRPPPPPFSLDLEPPSTPDHFPFLPRFFSRRKRPEPSTPEAPPPRDLVAGKPGHPGDRNHLHPNGDPMLSPAVPSPDLAVPYIDGELADPLSQEPLELEIELELRRLGSSAFVRRKRPKPSTPEAPPPRDLVAGKPGHPGDRNHLHPNGDPTLSPAVPSPDLAVPCIHAGELAGHS